MDNFGALSNLMYLHIYFWFGFLLFVLNLCTKCILVQFGGLFKDNEEQINSESNNNY